MLVLSNFRIVCLKICLLLCLIRNLYNYKYKFGLRIIYLYIQNSFQFDKLGHMYLDMSWRCYKTIDNNIDSFAQLIPK